MNWRRFSVVLFVFLLTTALFIPVVSGQSTDTALGSNTIESERTQSVPIDPELQTAAGTTEVVVRLAGMDGPQIAAQSDPVASLHSQADQTQRPVVEYAQQHDGINIKDRFWITNAVLLEVDMSRVSLDRIVAIKGVKRIHANFQVELAAASGTSTGTNTSVGSVGSTGSGTTASGYTYGLEQMNVPEVWQTFDRAGAGATVAVLDTGVDAANHSDLDPLGWKDFINNKQYPYDNEGHGTHVSGTVIGHEANGVHYGVAPAADLLHGKVLDKSGRGRFSNVIDGMQWAVAHEAETDVLSMSLGAPTYDDSFIDPIQNARQAGVVVVASSGNSGVDTSSSPGNVYEALSIGASNRSSGIAVFSSGETIDTSQAWGSTAPTTWPDQYTVPDVAAPGANIYSAKAGGGYVRYSGTSMAAPHVAGTVALIQASTDETISPGDIEATLTETAWKPGDRSTTPDDRYGAGIVDAYAAVVESNGGIPEAEFSIIDASINTTEISIGDSVSTSATIENTGSTSGTFTAGLRINGTVSNIKSVTIDSGSTEQLSFDSKFTSPGTYSMAVNDTSAGNVLVKEPADIQVTDASISSSAVVENESFITTATVKNTGDEVGTFTAGLEINSSTADTASITVDPQTTETVRFESSFSNSGIYLITVNNTYAGELIVDEPVNVATRPSNPTAGERVTIVAPVSSPRSDIEGISGGSHEFESIEISEIRPEASSFDWSQILWNDNQNNITVKWSAVAPADAAGKNLNISFNVEYADRDSRRINNSIVIGDESTIISYYANENGRIGDREIFSAVRDWQRNNGFFEYRSREESNTLIFKLVRIWQQNN